MYLVYKFEVSFCRNFMWCASDSIFAFCFLWVNFIFVSPLPAGFGSASLLIYVRCIHIVYYTYLYVYMFIIHMACMVYI